MNQSFILEATEAGDPAVDAAAFRRCLGQFGTGVTVVTACSSATLVGMTANSFSSVSLDPPLILWSAKVGSPSFAAFDSASHFAVNVLARDQVNLSKHFGKSGPDKFDSIEWEPGAGGAPILKGAIASFECRRVASHPGGDHRIFVGQVERFARYEREALLFAQGRYSVAAEHPEATSASSAPSDQPIGPMNAFLTSLLYRAHGSLSEALEEGRRAEGLTLLQTRLMSTIETLPGKTLDELLPYLYLGANAARGTLDQLKSMAIVAETAEGGLSLTPHGTERNKALLARARAIEERNLLGLSKADIASCRRILRHLIGHGEAKALSSRQMRTAAAE